MDRCILSETEELKVIYKEIIDGCSYIDNKNIYIKHLNELENGELAKTRQFNFLKFN